MSDLPDRPTAPYLLRASAGWAWRILVLTAAVYLAFRLFAALLFVVAALVAALLLAALLQPLDALLRRARLPGSVTALLTVLLLVAVVAGSLYFVSSQAAGQFDELGASLSSGVDSVQQWLTDTFGISGEQLQQAEQRLRDVGTSGGLAAQAVSTAQTLLNVFAAVILAVFVLFFLLRDGERIWGWTLNLFTVDVRDRVDTAGGLAWKALAGYVQGQALIAVVDAVFIAVGLAILGVPLVLPLALLVFLGAFVPIIGSVVAGSAAILVAFVANGVTSALITLGIVIGVQQIEGNILQPFIQRKLTSLHPLAVVVAVSVGTTLAGVFGALVSVPLTAVVAVVTGYLGGLHRARSEGSGQGSGQRPGEAPDADPDADPGARQLDLPGTARPE